MTRAFTVETLYPGARAVTVPSFTVGMTGGSADVAMSDGADLVVTFGRVPIPAPGTDRTGTLAATEAADAVSAAGFVRITGTLTAAEAADGLSATGTPTAVGSGSLAVTEAADVLTATGDLAVAGSFAATEAADTVSASGNLAGASGPANTVAPAVTGTGYVGQTLTTTDGTWTGSPTSYTYQWQRNTGSWTDISGATSSTYAVTLADEGVPVRCVVTATNAGGSTAANSNSIEQWVPDDLGVTIVAWWDAYSPSTITHSGGAVSSWASRVGSVTADQATGSNQPTYSATARNSRPGITGDGGDRLQFSSMSTFPNGSAVLTIAAAHYLNNTSATSLDTLTGYGSGSIMINAYTPWGEALRTRYDDSSNTRTANGPASIPNTDAVSLHYYRSGQVGVRGNGNTEATDIRVNDIPSSGTGGFIFARGAFGNWFTRGTAKEILYINADVTGSDAESLEGYLAHRWGATAMLPSGHPYKATAPIAGGGGPLPISGTLSAAEAADTLAATGTIPALGYQELLGKNVSSTYDTLLGQASSAVYTALRGSGL